MVNQGRHLATNDDADTVILAERGITFSGSANSAVISIPDRVENNNTNITCAGFLFGSTEFSDPVTLTIIGESVTDSYEADYTIYNSYHAPLTVLQVPLYLLSQF